MPIRKSQKAPTFTLPACDGESAEPLALEDVVGQDNVVLAFFPLAFSPVCTDELCEFRDQLSALSQLNARVYGVSVDSPYALNAFSREQGLNFPLLSDFNKAASQEYGVLHEELAGLKGVSKRSVFVIDRGGTVQYAWVSDDPLKRPDLGEIKGALQGLG